MRPQVQCGRPVPGAVGLCVLCLVLALAGALLAGAVAALALPVPAGRHPQGLRTLERALP